MNRLRLTLLFILVASALANPAQAQRLRGQPTGSRGEVPTPAACAMGRWMDCEIELAIERGLFETGLTPSFPAQAECRGIDEGFAIMFDKGGTLPADTKVIWPYTCRPK